jgi:phosphoglucomutase
LYLYLLGHRPAWPAPAAIGKTVVNSSMIDRVVHKLRRRCPRCRSNSNGLRRGCCDASHRFGGEESVGASFLRRDGSVWTTDKDGPIIDLLAAEITARTGKDPGEHYDVLTAELGAPHYMRIGASATLEQKARLERSSPEAVRALNLAGEPIVAKLTLGPENGALIGRLRIVTRNGWFAGRQSGTEAVYKIYADSFKDEQCLQAILDDAQQIAGNA